MSNAKSPVMSHFGAAIAGLISIRAYGAQDTFKSESLKRINNYTRSARSFYNLNRYAIMSCSRSRLIPDAFEDGFAFGSTSSALYLLLDWHGILFTERIGNLKLPVIQVSLWTWQVRAWFKSLRVIMSLRLDQLHLARWFSGGWGFWTNLRWTVRQSSGSSTRFSFTDKNSAFKGNR